MYTAAGWALSNALRQELHALSVDHLRTILTAYDLEPEAASSVVRHSATIDTVEGLTERIVAGVKRILGHR